MLLKLSVNTDLCFKFSQKPNHSTGSSGSSQMMVFQLQEHIPEYQQQ